MKKESSNTRILVVDDDPDIRLSLQMLLEFQEYSCEEAEDGRNALNLIRNSDFDLIITDYQMPQMDGFELLKNLNAKPSYARTPVIILSGSLDKFLQDQAMEVGAYAVLQKPYDGGKLLPLVKQALDSSLCPCLPSS